MAIGRSDSWLMQRAAVRSYLTLSHTAIPSGAIAVENINLDIKGGEIIALLGPSGCGKTTLLRIVAGFIAQTQGRIIIGDEIVDTLPPTGARSASCSRTTRCFRT